MNNSSKLILIFMVTFALTACPTVPPETLSGQTFSPKYTIEVHPLINKIWSVSAQNYVSIESLKDQVLKHDVILLGETHDNARHHQLQAQFIAHLIRNHRSPGIAFEMLNHSQQKTIDQFQVSHRQSKNKTDTFSEAIQWQKSGWPEWPYYRPVFYQSIENNRPVIAANLDSKLIRQVIKQGSGVLDQNYQDLLTKYQYNETLKQELEQEILSAHCDMLPEKMLSPMLMGQQVRDLSMTQAILSALDNQKSNEAMVLIAGSGHTRNDYGVPYYLKQEAPEFQLISIAFAEVSEDGLKPEDYAQAWGTNKLPFDYIWFTPRAEREDQCEKMKAYMKQKK